jgi:ABC-type antimicrobial peptide transport system permease subunit
MRFIDYIKAAFKNLRRQKLRSFLTIIAVVVGATSVVSLLALVFGASQVFVKQLESIGAFNQVIVTASKVDFESGGPFGGPSESSEETEKKLDDKTVKQIKEISHVVAVSPSVDVWSIESVRLKGSDKKYRLRLVAHEPNKASEKTLLAGRNLSANDTTGVTLISTYHLKSFGYEENPEGIIGQKVIFTTNKGYSGEGAEIPGPQASKEEWDKMQERTADLEAEVVGVTSSGPSMIEGDFYIPLAWAKGIMSHRWWEEDEEARKKLEAEHEKLKEQGQEFDYGSQNVPMKIKVESELDRRGYNTLVAKVADSGKTKTVKEGVEKLGFGAITAQDILDQVMRIFTIVGTILGAIGAISLGVAAIGIINTMIMATYERTREIGVMRACGATKGTVLMLFTFESALLGFFGGIFGIFLGYLLSFVANYFGASLLESQGIAVTNITAIPWWLSLSVVGFTTLLGFLSGLYPAFKASRLNPVEALRYE